MVNQSEISQTPALLIDLDVVDRNISRLADYARTKKIGIRPHTKTHKSLVMARKQISTGAVGLTAAKAGELEIMSQASDDLLLAYPAVDAHRCERIAKLARGKTIRVAVDSPQALDALSTAAANAGATIGILVDLDIGFHRTGLQTPAQALELAQTVAKKTSLRLDGLFIYPGHLWAEPIEQSRQLAAIADVIAETLSLWKASGLEAKIVSGGSTPTAYQSHFIPQLTEIRPGTYIYNDMNTVNAGFCGLDDCAARFVCTVVSNAVPGKVVIDAGTKTLAADRNAAMPDSGHGHVVEYPAARIVRLSEEHGEIDVSKCDRAPGIGQRVHVIPNHICPCVNLQDGAWIRGNDKRLEWLKTDARGMLT